MVKKKKSLAYKTKREKQLKQLAQKPENKNKFKRKIFK